MTKSKKQLCHEYQISYKTLIKWLNSVPNLNSNKFQKVFNPEQLRKIYAHLGQP